jgi:hypothetical protein
MQRIQHFDSQRSLLSMISLLVLGTTALTHADFPNAQPYPEVRYEYRTSANPPQQIHVARVDLSDSDVDVRVAAGGADPDGIGEFQTTLQTSSEIAERERFEVAVNGDFFAARKAAEGEAPGYVTGKWAKALGPAVTDGHLWAPPSEPRAALVFDAQKRVRFATLKEVPADALQVIAGSHIILRAGKTSVEDAPGFIRTRHPRTAVGLGSDGKTLVLVVVDGRRPGEAVGMNLIELADLMRQLGCQDAINLDGGGSSALVMRNSATGKLQVMNRPSDKRERSVANVLGLSIRGTRRIPISATQEKTKEIAQ